PPSVGKLVKNPSQRKVEQLLGRGAPQVGWATKPRAAPQPPNAAAAAANAARVTAATQAFRARRENRSDSESDGEGHHVSDLVYHARERLEPGRGVFKPTKYLDEWKQATIGTLSGALIDLEDVPPAVEKGAAWWE